MSNDLLGERPSPERRGSAAAHAVRCTCYSHQHQLLFKQSNSQGDIVHASSVVKHRSAAYLSSILLLGHRTAQELLYRRTADVCVRSEGRLRRRKPAPHRPQRCFCSSAGGLGGFTRAFTGCPVGVPLLCALSHATLTATEEVKTAASAGACDAIADATQMGHTLLVVVSGDDMCVSGMRVGGCGQRVRCAGDTA